MERKKILLTITTVAFMLTIVISATYAFFAMNSFSLANNTAVNTDVSSSKSVFTSYSNNPLSLAVSLENMVVASTTSTVTDTGDLIVELSSPMAGEEMDCIYDIQYVWDSTDQYVTPSMAFTAAYPYEISIAATVSATGDSYSNYTYTSKNLVERDLSTLSWNGTAGTAGRYATVIEGAKIYSNTVAGTKATWTFNMKFYTLPASQNALAGKSLVGHLTAANIQC